MLVNKYTLIYIYWLDSMHPDILTCFSWFSVFYVSRCNKINLRRWDSI